MTKRQIREGNSFVREEASESHPGAFHLLAEPSSSEGNHLEPRFATQPAEVGAQEEARVMNQDKPISNA